MEYTHSPWNGSTTTGLRVYGIVDQSRRSIQDLGLGFYVTEGVWLDLILTVEIETDDACFTES
jgi:hypothetical protein